MKTLAFILNFNTPEITNKLYNTLYSCQSSDYDLYILDNGSDKDKRIIGNHVLQLEKNQLFGGALNIGFKYILSNDRYDSLFFINSDIIVHPYNFVKSLRTYLNEYTIISPSIIQPENQCHWKQMHQWNSNCIRPVKWSDFQCPLIHRKFIENIRQYDFDLRYGWGNDVLSGMICEENNWKIGVCDNITALHLDGYTTKNYKHLPEISNYNKIAEKNMFDYFNKINKLNTFIEYRKYAENYNFVLTTQ